MKCLDDASDDLVQNIEYGRFAVGTKLLDGSIKEMDSSGDIGLFCRGLLEKIITNYGERFTLIQGEEASKLDVKGGVLESVTTTDKHVSVQYKDLNLFISGLADTPSINHVGGSG